MRLVALLVLAVNAAQSVHGKVYERCELAKELVEKHEAPMGQVATWVCIAEHESQYNTSAVGEKNGDNSKDHGIFQISDLFWCSPPGNGWACGVTCAELEDDNIEDDFICARRIYREHKLLSGNGFNAWVVYHTHCAGNVQSYIEGCFEADGPSKNLIDEPTGHSATSESSTASQEATTGSTTESLSTTKSTLGFGTLTSKRFNQGKPWFQWFSDFRWS